LPSAAIDVRVAALVGMAAMFAGASRAMLASTVFAFETTLQPFGLLPLLGGCAASYLVATMLSKNSLMTEKIVRRGVVVPTDYVSDPLEQITVRQIASSPVVTLAKTETVGEIRRWLTSDANDQHHQGFPVVDAAGRLAGVVTRRDLLNSAHSSSLTLQDIVIGLPRFVYEDTTVRKAADHMVNHDIGRLPVVSRERPGEIVGIVTRSDILSAYRGRLNESTSERPTFRVTAIGRRQAIPKQVAKS
jgi:CBS domain-containing protein